MIPLMSKQIFGCHMANLAQCQINGYKALTMISYLHGLIELAFFAVDMESFAVAITLFLSSVTQVTNFG